MDYMMKNKTLLPETHQFLSADEVLKNLPSSKGFNFSSADIQRKIDKLQKEADYQMALETFLDCDDNKIKKTKRVYGLPKKYR
jgi:hypothetical protein